MTLKDDQIAELDGMLQRQEAELDAAVHAARQGFAASGNDDWPEVRDAVEDGDARMMASLDLSQLQRNEVALHEVREARQRVREGHYGVCEDCGKPIRFERLKIMPATRYCVQDEERRERAGTAP
ncbi:TraR/DksA C4-type zinc finger protein [Ramlibacter sp. AW1]|uniref:TraR/DksA C4-type zinc finger protein n=1 Tax=Ramlibacter aurantiacus TaxID=2801330 RepID=A0A937D519_9BURK|nr:TraR/DksA C4-type zinc finger protein [Ramlibacter aurantiacus]MBL0422285.1 TraR/DksA C4-type zinc finger protein [Ramlibacter aurantiacus]